VDLIGRHALGATRAVFAETTLGFVGPEPVRLFVAEIIQTREQFFGEGRSVLNGEFEGMPQDFVEVSHDESIAPSRDTTSPNDVGGFGGCAAATTAAPMTAAVATAAVNARSIIDRQSGCFV
jgi:hypothetical protein